jgi:ABC-type molybdate transport system ATPase subunit
MIQELRRELTTQQARFGILNLEKKQVEARLKELKRLQELHIQARDVILAISKDMRQEIKALFDRIVTVAVQSVFDSSLEFYLDFNEEKSEILCCLRKNGEEHPILDFVGEGLVDVISFALRICVLLISRRPKVVILDEPFRFLDKARHPLASEMISKLSKELSIQFIIVTHSDDLMESGDRVFQVGLKSEKEYKYSQITET